MNFEKRTCGGCNVYAVHRVLKWFVKTAVYIIRTCMRCGKVTRE